jgi:hypothetical protein
MVLPRFCRVKESEKLTKIDGLPMSWNYSRRQQMICSKICMVSLSMVISILLCECIRAADNSIEGIEADSSGYVEISHVKLYYEIFGEGAPLLYLHGGLSSSNDFREYLPEFSKYFKQIILSMA